MVIAPIKQHQQQEDGVKWKMRLLRADYCRESLPSDKSLRFMNGTLMTQGCRGLKWKKPASVVDDGGGLHRKTYEQTHSRSMMGLPGDILNSRPASRLQKKQGPGCYYSIKTLWQGSVFHWTHVGGSGT